MILSRLSTDRRRGERRHQQDEPVLSLFEAFERDEREAWRSLDRRICLRRDEDVRRRIADQQ